MSIFVAERQASPSSTTRSSNPSNPLTRNQQQDGINDPGRISKVTLEYLNQLLLRYPEESRQIASDIVGGFQEETTQQMR